MADAAAITFDAEDVEATRRAARAIARSLPPTACITLDGELGAGKTTFVKALAEAVGIDPAEVHSPTFGLVHVHDVPPDPSAHSGPTSGPTRPARLVHVDAYRLGDAGALASIGWEEIEHGPGWLVVEWAERIADGLPSERLAIRIDVTGVDSRRIVCTPVAAPPFAAP